MDTAKSLKEKGNQLVQERKFQEALECYTKAIAIDSKDPILFSNRSLMYYNLKDYDNAIKDADVAILLKPNHSKAYLRKGNALEAKKKYYEALNTYNAGLQNDENNTQLLEAYDKLNIFLQNQTQNNHEDEFKDLYERNDKNLVEKYALKKNVKIYFDKQIGENSTLNGTIEEIKDGFIYFKDEHSEFHILNLKNIIDIKVI